MNDDHDPIHRDIDATDLRTRTLAQLGIGLVLILALLWWGTTHAATASDDSMTIQLKRGSSIVTLVPAPATLADCEQRKAGLVAIDAETRFSGTATYSCIETRRSVVTFSADPPPPPPPQPVDCVVSAWGDWVLGTPSACVAGSQTRTDARTRTVTTPAANGGAACPALSESRTVTLTCAADPPPAATPVLTAAAPTPGTNVGRWNVKLTWTAIEGATSYRVERCVSAGCSNFSGIKTATANEYTNTNLPSGYTYTYRVFSLTPTEGERSNGVTVTTPTAAEPPPPPPTGTGTAKLSWSAPTLNTDGTPATIAGYRFVYSTVGDAGPSLSQVLNLGPVLTHEFTGLTSGPWAFAIIAIDTRGFTSQQSNLLYVEVP